jgi:hypothetical protein
MAGTMVLLTAPVCPSCGKPMETGYFATNGVVAWQPEPSRWALKGGNVFPKTHMIQNWHGWSCPGCQLLLVDYSKDA